MKFQCPTCGQPFIAENINIQTDVALCAGCNQISRPSDLVDTDYVPASFNRPPKGAWYRTSMNEIVIGATTRHPMAFFLVPFACVWSGGSMAGIYGTQIKNGSFNWMMSLFGLPFLVGSIFLISATLMAIFGKVEVRLRGRRGTIFVGIGSLGWKRAVNLDEVETITEEGLAGRHSGYQGMGIVLQGRTRLRFATNLNETRRYFVLNALRAIKAGKA